VLKSLIAFHKPRHPYQENGVTSSSVIQMSCWRTCLSANYDDIRSM